MKPQTKPTHTVSLDSLYQLVRGDLQRVDALILGRVQDQAPLIYDVAHHIIKSGGKRIRPAITLIAAQACGYTGDSHIGLAAAVELLHTATLLHDDVVDESALRRSLPTANETFGNKASILVGDFLLSQAFQLMVAGESVAGHRLLADASAVISQGEVLQLMHQGNMAITEGDYMAILSAKTAVLFATAAELGAVISGKTQWEEPLRAYGHAVGLAFQIVDDALDYTADEAKLGKRIGDDFREGKITLPVLMAYRAGNAEEKTFWQRTMSEHEQQDGDFTQANAYLGKHAATEQALATAQQYASHAKAALAPLPESPAKNAMRDLADFCIARAF